jgi:hypothetical protein
MNMDGKGCDLLGDIIEQKAVTAPFANASATGSMTSSATQTSKARDAASRQDGQKSKHDVIALGSACSRARWYGECQLERGSARSASPPATCPPVPIDHTLGSILKAGNQSPK